MNLALMLLIDRQFLDTPFYGVRQMTWHLQNGGHPVNAKRIRRLMRLMRRMEIPSQRARTLLAQAVAAEVKDFWPSTPT